MENQNNEQADTKKPFRYKREDWAPALSIFSEISTWIAVPIILAVIGGKYLDTKYGTKPLYLIVCAVVAFLVTAYGIVKSVKNFAKKENIKK